MACRAAVLRTTVFLTEPWPRPLPTNSFSATSHKIKSSIPSLSCGCGIARARDFHFSRRTHHRNCAHNETASSSEEDHDQGPPQEAVLKAISEVSKAEGRIGQTTNVVIGGTVTDDSTNEWLALDQKVNSYPTVRGFTAIGTGGDDFVHAMVVAVESVLQQPVPEMRFLFLGLVVNVTWEVDNGEIVPRYQLKPRSAMVPFQMSIYQEATWEKWLMLAGPLVHDDIETHFEIYCNLLLCMSTFYVVNYNSQTFLMLGQVKHKLSTRGKYVSVNIGPVRVISSEQVQAVYNAMRRDDRMKYFL
ncbi:hypothetical protein RHMOL_Rhmol12G0028600 [Rhododendron molle]|uniref:Uncharacterized protein n=1 Tax=Rhododendron molle TaxID=49168 RepID=A0ACC0LDT9_RHOML|nr:hypothetical protein RHMOL_Rhmol12G0028600 [Rhododendron molle]